jgi:two-component system copper resistance phosphate regulon response regulator CusR
MAHLLVVDDEPRVRNLLALALQRDGHCVSLQASGAGGLAAAESGLYDLVVLDLMLPGMDGFEVLKQLLERQPGQRVLVLSAVGDVGSKVRCLQLGATDYVAKPFAVAELLARLRLRLHEPGPAVQQRWLCVGSLRLDLQRRVLAQAGQEIALSQKEFVLLGHLMRRAGEVCSRDELLAAVWGYGIGPGSNVVDVCVRRIRAKLTDDPIETVRNVGYCLAAG